MRYSDFRIMEADEQDIQNLARQVLGNRDVEPVSDDETQQPETPDPANNPIRNNPQMQQALISLFQGLFGAVLSQISSSNPQFASIIRTILSGNSNGFNPNQVLQLAPAGVRPQLARALDTVDPRTGNLRDEVVLDQSGGSHGINVNPNMNPLLNTMDGASRMTQRDAVQQMSATLRGPYARMQSLFGGPVRINDAIARAGTSRERETPGSQHFHGTALDLDVSGMNDEQRRRLAIAALEAGFTGLGFGNNILHVDRGPRRSWAYGNSSYGGESVSSWNRLVANYRPGTGQGRTAFA